jgi:hypothetical protein
VIVLDAVVILVVFVPVRLALRWWAARPVRRPQAIP